MTMTKQMFTGKVGKYLFNANNKDSTTTRMHFFLITPEFFQLLNLKMLYPYQAHKFMFKIIHKNTTLKALSVALNMFKIDNKVIKTRLVPCKVNFETTHQNLHPS